MSSTSAWSRLLNKVRESSKTLNPAPLLVRGFTNIDQSPGDYQQPDFSDGNIRIMQWNLLAQGLCQTSDGFILCPTGALNWDFRQYHLLEELLTYQASIYCLQEVDHFDYIKSTLNQLGYDGIFHPKPDSPCLYQPDNYGPDGCAIFWSKAQLELVSHNNLVLRRLCGTESNQVAIICQFKVVSGPSAGKEFVCVTTHLKAKKHHAELRSQQGLYLEQTLREKARDLPLVVCGDFNADPDETVVEVMKKSQLNLLSAYTLLSSSGQEPPLTTCKVRGSKKGGQEESVHTIDYLFFSKDKFQCVRLLEMPLEEQLRPNFLPSYAYPSDHLSLAADLKLIV
ncbi:nocturnin-like [Elysia marginata]|uniref:Nocturnin n=1 Tax=Elysia marginata TaxID=1093978 RepID=A0AAV4IS48_9GAST|nr:nocturnin-like [Elysia marginata]